MSDPGAGALERELLERLGPSGVLTGADATPYVTDWRGLFHGKARLVLRPRTAEDAAAAVAICARHGAQVVPQGGNTGLCGGATPDDSFRQVVLVLSRLNRVRDIDSAGMTMMVEAGATLQTVRDAAEAAGLAFPLSISSQGSAQIGGVLSTNAGGNNTLRYGNARDLVLGLEMILPDGRLWDGMRRLRKDNTGYALRHLFMGAEGTLGIITAASLRLVRQHRSREVALVALATPEAALTLLRQFQDEDAEALHAFEYISGDAFRMVLDQMDGTADPFEGQHPHYALVELATARRAADLKAALESVLAEALNRREAEDAVVAASEAQTHAFWRLREEQAEAQQRAGPTIKNDISVPVAATPTLIAEATLACAALSPGTRIVPFGHLGDGNIHFNLVAPQGAGSDWLDDPGAALIHSVTEVARRLGGSFSAEHGIGQLKRHLLADWREGVELDVMRAIKRAIDPEGLMNPGKLL